MTLDLLLAWWNLIYVLPFALALLYLFLYAASGITFGEADADADLSGGVHGVDAHVDVDHDIAIYHDVDVDHDVDIDHDVDVDHDVAVDADADADHDLSAPHAHAPEPGSIRAALMWLGVGRVPLSILLMVLLLAWGAAGFIANQLAADWFNGLGDWRLIMVSLPAAMAMSLLVTRVVVRSIDRWVPLDETTARRRHDLLGFTGEAMYDITSRFGMLSVHDDRGELYQVPCRLEPGHPTIAKHDKAVLVSFNARERLYHVVPLDSVGVERTPAREKQPG
jgi:hypothetical protein